MEQIKEVTPTEVIKLIKGDDNVEIIDVREDEEVEHGMIEGARHIALDKIPYAVKELDKDKHFILVCRSGGRSMIAASYLNEHGFKVSNMKGGMLEWDGEIVF